MAKYRPTTGKGSEAAAKRTLERDYAGFNSFKKHCPIISRDCLSYRCAAWKEAEVYLKNPGRLTEDQSIYDIELGYCKSPLLTGEIKVLK